MGKLKFNLLNLESSLNRVVADIFGGEGNEFSLSSFIYFHICSTNLSTGHYAVLGNAPES